jgi:lycopene cyclase domain-containing protein
MQSLTEFFYLFFNLGAVFFAFALSKKAKLKINYIALFCSYVLISLPFIVWDIWAVSSGHWWFNQDYVIGLNILGIAIEEIMFFVSVPYVMTVIYLCIRSTALLGSLATRALIVIIGLIGLVFTVYSEQRGYTNAVGLATILISIGFLFFYDFSRAVVGLWKFQLLLLAVFIVANSFLTALPIIEYGQYEFIGFRIGTIPVEDFLFNFILINTFITVYMSLSQSIKFDQRKN